MLIGRFLFIVPLLAAAGSLAAKKHVPITSGTFPTHGGLFVGLLVGTVVIVGALTFFPALVARADRRAFPHARRDALLMPSQAVAMRMTPEPRRCRSANGQRSHLLLPTEARRARGRCSIRRSRRGRSKDSFVKLNPITLAREPGDVRRRGRRRADDVLLARDIVTGAGRRRLRLQISLWLWFTVLFANFAEAMAEARGKAQADTLRKTKTDVAAKRLIAAGRVETRAGSPLRAGDVVVCEAGDIIPGDGEVIEGIATVDESVITGESAPVIRESGGDRSAVTGGTQVLSDWVRIRITSNPGETFLDRMIALVEGAERQKTPNEIALNILIAGLTLIFLLAVVTLQPFASLQRRRGRCRGRCLNVAVLVSLLVCLIPTTIGGLLSAIGIAGMDRVMQHNVLAMSGRAVEASGDVNTLLLDKTGTITLGNRQAVEFLPVDGVSDRRAGRCGAAVEPGR